MENESPNRFRISTRFTSMKVFVWVVLAVTIVRAGFMIKDHFFIKNGLAGTILGLAFCSGMLYFFRTRKRLDYDDIKQELYVVEESTGSEVVIPVRNIDKIGLSSFGFSGPGNRSWVISYRDDQGMPQKVRLYPIPFGKDVETLITDAQLANPDLVVRRWTFGWNELWD